MRFLGLLLLFALPLFAQQKGWQELTISDGLSQGMIFDLVQDPKGFIWIATKDGLNRYDGHNFTVYTHDPYNDYSLSDNNCSALLIDSRGWLWVGTLNQGLNLFDTRTQRFYHLNVSDQTSANAGSYVVNRINEDPQGNIWVTDNTDKLFKLSLSDALKTSFPVQANISGQVQIKQISLARTATGPINHVSFRADGQALAVYSAGLYAFKWQNPTKVGTFSPLTDEPDGMAATHGDVNQSSWFATSGNTIVCSLHGSRKIIPLPQKDYASIFLKAIDSTTLAIAATDFLWLMSPNELVRQDSLTARNAFAILPPDIYTVNALLKDQTGNIWVGTSGYGLRKFNPKVKQFHLSLPNTTLSSLYEDQQGRLYVRHKFAYEQVDRARNRMLPFLSNSLSPADKRQRYMMQDHRGTFWVSNTNFETHEMSLFKFSTDWELLKKYPLPPNTAFGFYGNQTVEDKAGQLWIGAINGKILRFDPQTETFRVFSYQSLLPQKGAEIETYALYFDQIGTLWIATQQGLVRADHSLTNPTFSIYKNSRTNRQSLSNDFVLSMLDDPYEPGRYVWIGTKGGGLERLNKQTGSFDHVTEAQGLPNSVVYGILTDEFNNLWLSTNRGLAQFSPRTRAFRNYTKADGLQDDEFNTGSFFKTPSNELLFGGINGLTAFRAGNLIQASSLVPQAHLIGLKVNNEDVIVGSSDGILPQGIEYTDHIELDYTQNLLTLEFSVMDFANSVKNRYRYRLEGIDHNWVEAGTNRFANYAQLPPGSYTFQMIGSVDGEVWNRPIELQIRVHPPFYQSWWAYLLYGLLLVIIGWQLYRFQMQRLLLEQRIAFEQKEANRLAELDGLKTQFFTNISHEFRTPLTLILGPLTDLKQRFPAESVLTLMERNGKRLLSLINQLLDLSKVEAGQFKAEAEFGDIAAFFRMVASSFGSLAQSRQIQFTFEQSEEEWLTSFDRDKLEKIVTNLLSNAFKFTPAGNEVRMTVRYPTQLTGSELIFVVQDTGIGIAPAHLPHIFKRFYQADGKTNRAYEGTGIGLALVNELIQALNGTIAATSAEGAGTIFTVTLPVVAMSGATSSHFPKRDTDSVSLTSFKDLDVVMEGPVFSEFAQTSTGPTHDNILLVIDDNPDVRTYVRTIFETDYLVIEAPDGKEGLEQATAILPTLVICDLMIPRLDGFGFCRILKTQQATSHIPVIMLTAKATVEDRIEGFELGADEYLTKPFNQAELQARVRNLIKQRQRLFQWFNANRMAIGSFLLENQAPISTLLVGEQTFLNRLMDVVHLHLSDPTFSVEALAKAVNLSRSQLHRKLKALTGISLTQFIREIRLAKAAELLASGEQNVTQVAYAVGFDNLSYFAKTFQEQYGVLPSQYDKSVSIHN